jgi:hypothetical protein
MGVMRREEESRMIHSASVQFRMRPLLPDQGF